MNYELISFKLCPFVQRAVITLLHKQVRYTVTYIDLADPPQWFRRISPHGKVPLLRVDNDTVLFESAVICEFIDETTPQRMHPEEPLQRALNRAWIEYGSGLFGGHYKLISATTPEELAVEQGRLLDRLKRVEQLLGEGPYFNGERFSLIDAAFAPLFMRLALLDEVHTVYSAAEFPKLSRWSSELLKLPEVQKSVVDDFPERYRAMVARMRSYAARIFLPDVTQDRVAS